MATVNINEFKPEDIDLKIEKRIPVTCKQFDNVILSFNVFDYTIPVDLDGYFIELKIQQPNGQKFTQSTGIVKTGNNVKITCANEVSNVYGKVKIELDFTNSANLKKSSFVIVINVKESIGGESEGGSATPGNGVPVALAIPLAELEAYVAEATVLNESFATNTATQATTQASLNASVTSAQNIADSVADSLETANNLNANVDTARALNDALVADIAIGNPLKTDLTSINSTASATKTALEAKIVTANEKIAEFESYDTSGLIDKVNSLQADVVADEANTANIQSEIATARNGKTNLKDGIVELIKTNAPVSSVVNDTNFTNLKNDVEAARLGEVSLVLGIRDAINAIVDPLKDEVNAISLTNADTTLRSEISDARMGSSTLKIGIQEAINNIKNTLELEIAEIDNKVGTDPALATEISNARNGEDTLKDGIIKLVQDNIPDTSADSTVLVTLLADVAAARLGQASLTIGIRNAIDATVDPLKTQINNMTLNNSDAVLRSEVSDARMGNSTLKIGIQEAISDAVESLQAEIDNISVGSGTDPVLVNEITDARNGELTLKAGISSLLSAMKTELEDKIHEASTADDFLAFESEIIASRNGANSLATRLYYMGEEISDNNIAATHDIAALQSDVIGVKENAGSTLKAGVQSMIDTAIENYKPPSDSITIEMVDALNVNLMNVIVSNEKIGGKKFMGMSDNMRVYSFVDLDTYVTISNGVYDKEDKCIKCNNLAIDSVSFCYD